MLFREGSQIERLVDGKPVKQAFDKQSVAQAITDSVREFPDDVRLASLGAEFLRRNPTVVVEGVNAEQRAVQIMDALVKSSGGSADALLGLLGPALPASDPSLSPRPEREAFVAALNGVLGDYLAATDNPLSIPMAWRQSGRPLDLDRASLRARLPGALV